MATELSSLITAYPGQTLVTLTNANKGYAFTYPVGVPLRISIQPHANSAAVACVETAITDGTTDLTASDQFVVAAGASVTWDVAPETSVKLPRATQFVLTSGTADTKVLIWAGELAK